MRLLACWISFCQDWSRLAETELELPEQPLALAHAQLDSVDLSDPRREGLAINTRLISLTCFRLNLPGRPERSPSVRPANPCSS